MYTTPGTNHRSVRPVMMDLDGTSVPAHLVDPKTEEFKLWRQAVSHLVRRSFGVSLDDLPDLMTRDSFDQGISPESFFEDDVVSMLREEYGNDVVDAALRTTSR